MNDKIRVVVGSDDAGYDYKEVLRQDLETDPRVAEVIDVGVARGEHTVYPDVAAAAARAVAVGHADRAVLVCGTGLGMAISANKVCGVRAVTAHDSYSVERSIRSNDAQVLCLGQRVVGLALARRLTREWLGYRFDPASPSAPKVAAIVGLETAGLDKECGGFEEGHGAAVPAQVGRQVRSAGTHAPLPGTILATSLKMYLGARQTRSWVRGLAEIANAIPAGGDVELVVLPSFPLIESAARLLAGTAAVWGAQGVAASDDGDQTGEVGAAVLAELGCRYVEIGHSERRYRFGETEEVVRAKLGLVVAHGMIPLLCVGEPEPGPGAQAVRHCLRQVDTALAGHSPVPALVVAYEPVWAIGAARPAPAEHVREVTQALAQHLSAAGVPGRVLYGGSAGPGTLEALGNDVDGLFLGRFVHDIAMLAQVVAEAQETPSGTRAPHD